MNVQGILMFRWKWKFSYYLIDPNKICLSTPYFRIRWQINKAQAASSKHVYPPLKSAYISKRPAFSTTTNTAQMQRKDTPCRHRNTHVNPLRHITTSFRFHHRIYFIANSSTERGCLYQTWQIVSKKNMNEGHVVMRRGMCVPHFKRAIGRNITLSLHWWYNAWRFFGLR